MTVKYVQRFGHSVGAVDGGFVVMDLAGHSHELDQVGLFVLECCTEPRDPDAIADLVRNAFAFPSRPVELVTSHLDQLLGDGLILDADDEAEPMEPLPATVDLEVGNSPGAGRGVFARRAFAADEIIERCPVIVIGPHDAETVQTTVLGRYAFDWRDGRSALALGFGSLYNHSQRANAHYQSLERELILEIVASEPIPAGREILIDYTGGGAIDLGYVPRPALHHDPTREDVSDGWEARSTMGS